jgi:hypothetical protein
MKVTLRSLASAVAKSEAGKSQTSIGNVREIIRVIAQLDHRSSGAVAALISKHGKALAKRKPRKK